MITAVNVAYDKENTRNFVEGKSLALAFTLGAIVLMVLAVALVAAVPAILAALDVPNWVDAVVEIARWIGLIVAVMIALAVLYRWAPDRADAKFRWLSVGSGSPPSSGLSRRSVFDLCRQLRFTQEYGSLAGVVVLLLWLWIAAYATLLGAEINAEMEQQTIKDTTTGEPKPLGQRGAVKADSIPGEEDERDDVGLGQTAAILRTPIPSMTQTGSGQDFWPGSPSGSRPVDTSRRRQQVSTGSRQHSAR